MLTQIKCVAKCWNICSVKSRTVYTLNHVYVWFKTGYTTEAPETTTGLAETTTGLAETTTESIEATTPFDRQGSVFNDTVELPSVGESCNQDLVPLRLATIQDSRATAETPGYVTYQTLFGYGFGDGTSQRSMVCDSEVFWHTRWDVKRK